jgi:hypothetical protein
MGGCRVLLDLTDSAHRRRILFVYYLVAGKGLSKVDIVSGIVIMHFVRA